MQEGNCRKANLFSTVLENDRPKKHLQNLAFWVFKTEACSRLTHETNGKEINLVELVKL